MRALSHLAVLPLSLFSQRQTSTPWFSISVARLLLPGDLYPDLQPLWINLPVFYLLHDAFSDHPIWKYLLSLHLHSTLSVTLLWHLYFPSWIVNILISKVRSLRGGLHIIGSHFLCSTLFIIVPCGWSIDVFGWMRYYNLHIYSTWEFGDYHLKCIFLLKSDTKVWNLVVIPLL